MKQILSIIILIFSLPLLGAQNILIHSIHTNLNVAPSLVFSTEEELMDLFFDKGIIIFTSNKGTMAPIESAPLQLTLDFDSSYPILTFSLEDRKNKKTLFEGIVDPSILGNDSQNNSFDPYSQIGKEILAKLEGFL